MTVSTPPKNTNSLIDFIHSMSRPFSNLPMRAKLTLVFMGMTIITVGTVFFLTNYVTQKQLLNAVGTNLKGQAIAQSSAVGALMEEEIASLRAFGLNELVLQQIKDANAGYGTDKQAIQSQIDALDKQWTAATDSDDLVRSRITGELADSLKTYSRNFEGNVEVFVTDKHGALLGATNRTSDYYQADEAWWQSAWNDGKGAIFISDPIYDDSSKSFSLDIAIPIYDKTDDQQVIGVLRTTYSLSTLAALIDSIHFGETGRAHLLMPDGGMLEIGGQGLIPVDAQTLDKLRADVNADYTELPFENVPSLVSQAPIRPTSRKEDRDSAALGKLGWTILIQQNSKESLRPITTASQVGLFAILGTLVLAAVLALGLSHLLVAPIKRLTQTARQIAAGDLDQHTYIQQTDEIGQLASVFNSMTEHLNELIRALEGRLDEVQAARERAERADKVKSAFLASVSHELRTPLNSVINYTKFVAKEVMGPVNDRQRETLNKVINSGKHLLQLINDVLDISKIESGSLTLFLEDDVNLNEILKMVTSTAEGLLTEQPVNLEVDIEPDLPLVIGDKQRILQIMINIVSNACKFTEEGFIKVRAYRENNDFHFSVQDTGQGIAAEDYAAVFEPFKQTQTGLHKGEGTGLGMPISKRLAEAHDGCLWFESAPGQGTTFHVTLPIKIAQPVPVAEVIQ